MTKKKSDSTEKDTTAKSEPKMTHCPHCGRPLYKPDGKPFTRPI